MSGKTEKRGSERQISALRQQSTENLEQLLMQEFSASDVEMDVEYLKEIMEVMKERQGKQAWATLEEADAALEEFHGNRHAEEENDTSESDSSPLIQIQTEKPRKQRKRPVLRAVAIAAALIVLICGTASAFGINVLHLIATWTENTIQLISVGGEAQEEPVADPFLELREAVAAYSDAAVVPYWAPAESSLVGIEVYERLDRISIRGTYYVGEVEIILHYTIRTAGSDMPGLLYQRDDSYIETYQSNGVEYYITGNLGKNSALWACQNVEGVIQGDISITDLEKMVDSMIEE